MNNQFALNFLLNVILNRYFQNSRCLFIFSDGDFFEYKGSLSVINLNVKNSKIDEELMFRSFGCQGFLIHHQNVSTILIQIEQEIKLHSDRFNSRKYLILPTMQSNEDSLMNVFNLSELKFIVDFLVVTPARLDSSETCESSFKLLCNPEEVFKLVTNRYVGKDNNNVPEVIDWWFSQNYSFLYGNDLYPDKISNQQGRALRCATFNYKPYSILEKSPLVARGSENSLAHEYADRHNMTIVYISDDNEWGVINDDWTGNGILGNLATGKADIGYGALYQWEHEFGFLDFSKPTVRTGITCLVPAPRLAAGWFTPLFPFALEMWIGTAISFLIASLITIVLTSFITKHRLQINSRTMRHTKKKVDYRNISIESFQSIIAIFLIQSLPITNTELTVALKHMFVIFLFSILLASSYSSGLSTIMTVPRYENSIETVWDLANSGLNWTATQDAWIFSILEEERPQYITLVDRFIAKTPEELLELSQTNKIAFSLERLPSGQYAIGSYITEGAVKKLRLMHEDLYWEHCIFMLLKNSPLLESLDDFILRVFQAGLILFWERSAAQTHMDVGVQNIVKYYFYSNKKKQGFTVKLKMIHVEGVFAVLGIGMVLAGICFLFEVITYRYQNRTLNFN